MKCVVFDEKKIILAQQDISGTLWVASYNVFFNKEMIKLNCEYPGKPVLTQLQDDIGCDVFCQSMMMNVVRVGVNDVIAFPPGCFTIAWKPEIAHPLPNPSVKRGYVRSFLEALKRLW